MIQFHVFLNGGTSTLQVLGLRMDPATLENFPGQAPDPAARAATEQSHKNFIGDILNNFQLMARFSRFMRQANDFVFKAEEAGSFWWGKKIGGRCWDPCCCQG